MRTFVIIDGNALVHRCYHALPKTLRSPAGELTNAVYGFTTILLGILEYEKPDYLGVAFDMKGPTFRDHMYTEYKATRAKTDDDLILQFPRVREVLQAFSIPIFEKEGLEADDYLGIVSELLKKEHADMNIMIVTGDKDALQLVDERVTVITPISGYTKVDRWDNQAVKTKMGVWPAQIPDYKGLSGDVSDNIPGVPGIGKKTAVTLLDQFESIEDLYLHLDEVRSPRIRELLAAHEADAMLCKQLATIRREDGLSFDLKTCAVHDFDIQTVRILFEQLAFRTPLQRVEKLNMDWAKKRAEDQQGSLF